MDIFSGAERAMGMNAERWARHANPLSVYSRIAGGTLVFLSFWSVFWVGWYGALAIAAAVLWIVVNPRLFLPPPNVDSWASKGVLGERVFLNRKDVPIPTGYIRAGWITTTIALVFFGFVIYGFIKRDFWLAFVAWHAATIAKLWFVDRMALLWDFMKDADPTYADWARADWRTTLA